MPSRATRKKEGESFEISKAEISKDVLTVPLTEGQVIKTSPGSLIYMRGDVKKGEVKVDGLGKAFGRIFSGQSFFLTSYTGGPNGGSVALSLAFPGDIIQIDLQPNESYRISKGCFLAGTNNVEISATTQIKGIIGIGQEEGVILPVVKCKDGTGSGTVWLGGFGHFKMHQLKIDETIIVDNGIFLACPNSFGLGVVVIIC